MTARPPVPLLPTTVVGSYPQPGWLLDRAALGNRVPPRGRARDRWRVAARAKLAAMVAATRAVRATQTAGRVVP